MCAGTLPNEELSEGRAVVAGRLGAQCVTSSVGQPWGSAAALQCSRISAGFSWSSCGGAWSPFGSRGSRFHIFSPRLALAAHVVPALPRQHPPRSPALPKKSVTVPAALRGPAPAQQQQLLLPDLGETPACSSQWKITACWRGLLLTWRSSCPAHISPDAPRFSAEAGPALGSSTNTTAASLAGEDAAWWAAGLWLPLTLCPGAAGQQPWQPQLTRGPGVAPGCRAVQRVDLL